LLSPIESGKYPEKTGHRQMIAHTFSCITRLH